MANRRAPVQRVLLLSIDGMHSLDLARIVNERPDSALAQLSTHGVTYSNAFTAFPSNSWPGLLSMVTGGSPNATGVLFENSYDRSLSPPASDCSIVGTPVIFDSSIDINRDTLDGGGGIDPQKLPRDPEKGCTPVFPHDFVRVNTIFEVIKQSGRRTAWSDKHPAYDFVNGPSGKGVDDLFTPEVRPFRDMKNIESYDDLKVAVILNEIDAKDHTGSRQVGVPALFGMNFQAISVAQKTKDGGYLDSRGRPSPMLEEAFFHTDQSIGKLIHRLRNRNLLASTLVIVTAKHGDSPIDPMRLRHADLDIIPKTVASVRDGLLSCIEQDGSVALLWLSDQGRTSEVVDALRKIQSEAGIQEIYSGDALKLMFNDPKNDPRVPDIIIQPVPGQIYVDAESSFVAEHGGNTDADRHVPLLVSFPGMDRSLIKFPVQSSQIAPTILKLLGLNPNSLDAVRLERTPLLPGLDFQKFSVPRQRHSDADLQTNPRRIK
jgi:type I phosphodiesterase/nucleotide pyrophosphatase